MRLLIISALLFSSSWLRICGSESPAPPGPMPVVGAPGMPGAVPMPVAAAPVAVPPSPVAVAPTEAAPTEAAPVAPVAAATVARFGGTVVPVGTQSVEVIPMSDGQVVAYVNDPSGNPVMDGTGAEVAVKMGASSQPISLAWQQTDMRYSAVSEVQLQPGPVEVTLTQNGQAQTGRVEMVAVVQPPAHGGVVLAVGNYSSELLAKSDGTVVAYLNGPQGAVTADAGLQFVATVPGAGGTPSPVTMSYDAGQSCWVGRVAAGVQVAPGPLEVSVTTGGATAQGRFEALAPMPPAEHGGTVVATGLFGVEVVPGANGEIEAYVKDSQGAASAPDGLELSVNVHVGDRREPVVLAWSAPRRRFVGRIRTGVRVERAPVEVFVVNRGRRTRGRLAHLYIPPPPVVRIAAPPPPPVVSIRPPPPPVVRITAPPPPVVRVDVRPPPPPAVRVDVRPPPPPAVRVEVRTPPPPTPRGGVKIEVGGHGRGKRGGIDIRGGGGIRIGH